MELRNKKTGELGTLTLSNDGETFILMNERMYAHSVKLKDLEEWEDAPEEPKESEYYWYIGYKNDIRRTKYHHTSNFADNQVTETRKEIGNCFESLEKAEKAVEKLKAWKRLKDKGFMFCGTDCINNNNVIYFEFGEKPLTQSEAHEAERELDICFGGEE